MKILLKTPSKKDKASWIATQMLRNKNTMKREKSYKKFVIPSSKQPLIAKMMMLRKNNLVMMDSDFV
jgi:hypothetical protein